MYRTINEYEFRQAFKDMDRDYYSYEGYEALYEHLDEMCSSDDKGFELDVISICGEYTEYKNLEEFQKEYGNEEYENIEDIEENTMVLKLDNDRFIIQVF